MLSVLAVLSAACSTEAAELVVDREISYLEGEERASADAYRLARCVVDVERPQNAKGLPVLVWFHGGGLTAGDKHFLRPILRPEGLVQVRYRLMSETNGVTRGDASLDDAAAAVAWTFRHIAAYGGSPTNVFLSGSSAGGYLTMMLGMDPKWLGKYGYRTSDLAGLAPNSGQATTHFAIKKFRNDPRPDYLPVIDEYAPLYHTANWKDVPPIVCITGEPPYEWKGRAEENEFLIATLKALGHKKAWYVRLPYASHGRTMLVGPSYVEAFVHGQYPEDVHSRTE